MIIGITGTNGAGKGTVVDYLVKEKGFKHYSVRKYLEQEVKKRGLPLDRDHLRMVGNDLRQTHASNFIAEQLLEYARVGGGDAIIESLRVVGEALYMKSQGMFVWAVDADRKTRYERVVLRGSETDKVSFERFCEQEDIEMQNADPNKQNISAVIAIADAIFTNDTTPEDLYVQVEEALRKSAQP